MASIPVPVPVVVECGGTSIEYRAVHPAFGVEVRGLDLSSPLPDDVVAELRRALDLHSLLLFPEQQIEPPDELRFLRYFNEISDSDYTDHERGIPGFPQIAVLSNIIDEDGKEVGYTNRKGMEWHTDGSGWRFPPLASSLYALEVPQSGGETYFASGYIGYETLAPERRAELDEMLCRYSYVTLQKWLHEAGGREYEPTEADRERHPDVDRPLVRAHPATGRRALWFSIEEIVDISGMGYEASRELMLGLVEHLTGNPHAVYAHYWSVGDLVLWDNRCLLHSVCEYNYEGQRRLMHQISGKDLDFAV